MSEKLHTYKIDLVRVIDGNTFVADIDLGFNVTKKNAIIQLIGVEDHTEEYSVEDYTSQLKHLIENRKLTIYSHGLDGFRRVLSTVYIDNGDGEEFKSINDLMRS